MAYWYRIGPVAVALVAVSSPAARGHDDPLAHLTDFFSQAQVLAGPEIADCTLSAGTETRCFRITVAPTPRTYTPGPWCPTKIDQGAEAGGIWFLDGRAVDVDGAFVQSLAEIYGDSHWQLYDPVTGAIRFTGTLEACEAAARPDVDPAYQNSCVQCLPEYMPEGASMTYTIPLEPVMMYRPSPVVISGAGVANNGVRLDGPAPLNAILDAYTIAPFDDCGGHVNLHVGYHYHAVTDCLTPQAPKDGPAETENARAPGHGSPIGIAMDGHAVFPQLTDDERASEDLDACNGHETADLGYHYHAGDPGSNAILGCHVAETGCASDDPAAFCDASIRRPPRP